ncbi:phosphoribosyltransferase [Candidatus Berkelbacteria bacterium]|nr:phosphoribosyltransferase [Candidatus Berkelbacteria bacterium]
MMTFKDRVDAGKLLAFSLREHLPKDRANVLVVGLPRGGVVVASIVASELGLALDFLIVKKIGHPDNPEFAVGAVGRREIFLNADYSVDTEYVHSSANGLRAQIARQEMVYRAGRAAPDYADKTIVLVDDGIATGLTTKAAVAELRAHRPQKIILAVPVAAADSLAELSRDVDDVVCLYTPAYFTAVGQFYENFQEVSEQEVAGLLKNSGQPQS